MRKYKYAPVFATREAMVAWWLGNAAKGWTHEAFDTRAELNARMDRLLMTCLLANTTFLHAATFSAPMNRWILTHASRKAD